MRAFDPRHLLGAARLGATKALVLASLALGCGSVSGPAELPMGSASAPERRAAYPLPPKRSESGESALELLLERGASSWTAIDVAALRERLGRASPLLAKLAKFMPFQEGLRRADIRPSDDLDRAILVTHPSLTLVEHHVDEARVERFLADVDESGAERLPRINGRPCARLQVWAMGVGSTCALAPGLLLVTNELDAALWDRLAASRLPPPPEGEVAHAEVLDERLIRDAPRVDETSLGPGQVVVDVPPDRTLRLHAVFTSEDPVADHAKLSKALAFIRDLRVMASEREIRFSLAMTP